MKNSKPPSARPRKKDSTHRSRAVESLELWAKLGLRIELLLFGDSCDTIRRGTILEHQSPEGSGKLKTFEFVAFSGTRIFLDPEEWEELRTTKNAFGPIEVNLLSPLDNGFALHPVISSDEDSETQAAEEQLNNWVNTRTDVLVTVQFGQIEQHFAAKVVVSKDGEFGYTNPRSASFWMASPHSCGLVKVAKDGDYTTVKMIDERTGVSLQVTDGINRSDDLFAQLRLASKRTQ